MNKLHYKQKEKEREREREAKKPDSVYCVSSWHLSDRGNTRWASAAVLMLLGYDRFASLHSRRGPWPAAVGGLQQSRENETTRVDVSWFIGHSGGAIDSNRKNEILVDKFFSHSNSANHIFRQMHSLPIGDFLSIIIHTGWFFIIFNLL